MVQRVRIIKQLKEHIFLYTEMPSISLVPLYSSFSYSYTGIKYIIICNSGFSLCTFFICKLIKKKTLVSQAKKFKE